MFLGRLAETRHGSGYYSAGFSGACRNALTSSTKTGSLATPAWSAERLQMLRGNLPSRWRTASPPASI